MQYKFNGNWNGTKKGNGKWNGNGKGNGNGTGTDGNGNNARTKELQYIISKIYIEFQDKE